MYDNKPRFNIKKAVYKRDIYPQAYSNGAIYMYESLSGATYIITVGECSKLTALKTLVYSIDVKKFIPTDFEKPKANPWGYITTFAAPRAVEYATNGTVLHDALSDWKIIDESDLTKLYLTMDEGDVDDRFAGIY